MKLRVPQFLRGTVLVWALATACVATLPLAGGFSVELRAATVEGDASSRKDKPHAAAEEEPGPITWDTDLALWSLITFVIFVIVLKQFAWKPLIVALDKREARIHDDIAGAEAARVKAEQMLAEHAQKLAKVQDEVRAILAEGRRDAEHAKQEIIGTAQKEAESAKQRALHEIGRARDAALKDLFDVMASQVAQATAHVLGRSVTGADQDRLSEEALAQFPRH
jgi:F-type H+-transporting ATPase subunit b